MNQLSSPATLQPSHVIGKLCSIDTNTIIELDLEKNDADPSVNSAAYSDRTSDENEASKFKKIQGNSELGISLEEYDLSQEQKLRLYKFIAINLSSFAKDTLELGCINVCKHRIETGNAPPQCKLPYLVSSQMKQEIDDQIDNMLKNDIIEHSDCYWAVPIIICRKKDGTYRFVDYHDLNAVTKPINFPLPRMEDIMDSVGKRIKKFSLF